MEKRIIDIDFVKDNVEFDKQDKEDIKTVMFCLPGNRFTQGFLVSWTQVLSLWDRPDIQYNYSFAYTPDIYKCRNMLLGGVSANGINQKVWNGEIESDYIFFIDSDQVFTKEDIYRLIDYDLDIVSGLIKTHPDGSTTIIPKFNKEEWSNNGYCKMLDMKDLEAISKNNKDKLLEVDSVGLGFMCVKKEIFDKIGFPWFSPKMLSAKDKKDFLGEDISFCLTARNLGYNIYVDLETVIGHEKSFII